MKTFASTLACLALVGILGCSKSPDADNKKIKPLDPGAGKPEPVNKDKSQREMGKVLK